MLCRWCVFGRGSTCCRTHAIVAEGDRSSVRRVLRVPNPTQHTPTYPSPSITHPQPPSAAAADGTAPPEPLGTLVGKHEDSVWGVAWTPKGQLLSGSVDETLRVWDVTPGGLQQRHALGGHRLGVVAVAASGTEPREYSAGSLVSP